MDTRETEAEVKAAKKLFAIALQEKTIMRSTVSQILENCTITAMVGRFGFNTRNGRENKILDNRGDQKTSEILVEEDLSAQRENQFL